MSTVEARRLRDEAQGWADFHRRMGVPESMIEADRFFKIEELTNEIESIQEEWTSPDKREELEDDLEEAKNDLASAEQSLKDETADKDRIAKAHDKLTEDLAELRDRRNELVAEVDELKAENDRLRARPSVPDVQAADRIKELEEALRWSRGHTDSLDQNWQSLHEGAMRPIREALGLPDGSVPELLGAIAGLQRELAFVREERNRFLLESAMASKPKRSRKPKVAP